MSSDSCVSRYYPITDLDKLLHQITKNKTRAFFLCKACFSHYSSEEKFIAHQELCSQYPPTRIELPTDKKNILKFENFRHEQKIPYVIYANFECLLEKVSTVQSGPENSFTEEIQVHTLFSFAYYIVGPEKKRLQVCHLYRKK